MSFSDLALDRIQRQFGYTNLSYLITQKAEIWDVFSNLAKTFGTEIMGVETCIPDALDYFWGIIFKVTRNFKVSGTSYTLTDDEFREVLKIRMFCTSWDGTVGSLNSFIGDLLKERGRAFIVDVQNMDGILFVSDFELDDWEKALFPQILPRPAGVGYEIEFQIINKKYFGYGEYEEITPSPITVGFGTYTGHPTGEGSFATYNDGE